MCKLLPKVTVFIPSLQLNYLVNNDANVMGSTEFSEMVSSCAPEDVTRLHSYCYRIIIEKRNQLERLFRTLVDLIGHYYSGNLNN